MDFINTEVKVRGKPQDLLQTPADLADWWQVANNWHEQLPPVENGQTEFDAAVFQAAKQFRAALRNIFSKLAHGQNIVETDYTELNQVLGWGSPNVVAAQPTQAYLSHKLHSPDKNKALFQIALSALQIVTSADTTRLHQCKNARCILFFYDATRSATRQWCSQDCMNRARSSENYRRSKALSQS